jgi:hypothetical protein
MIKADLDWKRGLPLSGSGLGLTEARQQRSKSK